MQRRYECNIINYGLIDYLSDDSIESAKDSLILIVTNVQNISDNLTRLTVKSLQKVDFDSCKKTFTSSEDSFYIQEVIVHPWSNVLNLYS